jgi:cysteine sulfinate desulfinase/cysteine desulfurase-like protein
MGCSSLTQAQMDTLMDLASAHPAMRRWVMISLDVETSEDDVDVVLRRHRVKLQA